MKITVEPRSDQWNASDFIGGPRTFTIAGVKDGTAEQKYDIELVEGEGRVWRPPPTVLRILLSAWGDEAATWQGRKVTLYQDPSIRFGKDEVGGIRISHLSHIDKPLKLTLQISRGKYGTFTVQPLPANAAPTATTQPQPTADDVAAATDPEQLKAMWRQSSPEIRALIEARVKTLTTPADQEAH